MKVLIYNAQTGDIKASAADQNGKVFQKYIEDGYSPVGFVWGMNVGVSPFSNATNKQYFKDKSINFDTK